MHDYMVQTSLRMLKRVHPHMELYTQKNLKMYTTTPSDYVREVAF